MVLFISNLFLLKISFLFISITKGKYMDLINYESIIRLLIKGGGDKNFFGNEYPYEPSEVILNDVSKGTSCLKSCNMEYDEINNVTFSRIVSDYLTKRHEVTNLPKNPTFLFKIELEGRLEKNSMHFLIRNG